MTANPIRRRVLIATGEAEAARSIKVALEREGYDIETAASSKAALDALGGRGDERFDLALLDLDSGAGFDGPGTAMAIQAIRELPVAFISSRFDPSDLERASAVPSYGFIPKDAEGPALFAAVRSALRLAESEERYKRLVTDSRDVIYRLNIADMRYEYVSPAFEEITGYPADALVRNPTLLWDLIHPDYEAKVKSWTEMTRRGEVPPTYEYAIVRKDGSTRFVEQRNRLIVDSRATPIAVEGIVRDVTARTREELARREAEARTQAYLDLAGVIFVALDSEGRVTMANRMACETLGVPKEAILGMDWFERFVPKEVASEVHGVYRKIMSGELESVEYYENPLAASDGRERTIAWHNSLLRDEGGRIYGTISAGQDITERIERERREIRDKETLRALFDAIDGSLFMVGRDGVIQAANATFASRVGLTPEACVGTSLYGIGDPDMVAARRIHLERVLATGEPDVFEDERDGRCTHHALYPVKERGTTDRVVVYASDITERRRAEAQIAALLREKETLLKETHHRVKNNMSAVASLLSLQSYEMPDGPAAEALLEAASRVQSMSVMYDKLYRTERADALPADDFIRSLVEEALEATGRSGRVRAKIVAEAFQLPAATLTPLGIALNELVSNSLKHAFEGVAEPEILVWAERSDDSVCLSYRDNGKGIPMNVDFDGNTGFGMRLIQMLARQLGGDSRIERDGAGSAVVIRFKARRC